MKKSTFLVLFLSILVLSACNNNEENKSEETDNNSSNAEADKNVNLFSSEDVEEGYWINDAGEKAENSQMITSSPIGYEPNKNYVSNRTLYVSYYSGENFIKTLLHDEETPVELETVKEADTIRLSFDKKKLENFELIEK